MISLSAKIRKDFGRQTKSIRKAGQIPAVVYGPGVKNLSLEINYKDFQKVFKQAGESSLVDLNVESEGKDKKRLVLIHEAKKDPVSDQFIHVDFLQPSLKEEVEATVPLVFLGVAPAEKDLSGTLVKNITEVQVKALPQNLPHEIQVSLEGLKTFGDHISIKDLVLPKNIKVLKKPEEIVVSVAQQQKVEEELEKPIEEDVESVEKVVKEKKKEEEIEETAPVENEIKK
ncbi:MAG: 50S ribosomal protein L25 [Candidatus Staskawiczbacteria bacterium]|nr:50S ribosomal protein L25 [Candidatus Staskawiczbacteria bacterium]